jgi:hypothetical protein
VISSNPSAAEKQQYETWLSDAEAAYHRLLTGASEVTVSYDGESVTYRAATKAQLLSYIGELRAALGKPKLRNPGVGFVGVGFGRRPRRGLL